MYKVEILCSNGFTVNTIEFDSIGKAVKFVFRVGERSAAGLKVREPGGRVILQRGTGKYDCIAEKSR